ncbi:hypothetical protein [uncultured Mediterranean phage uvMED]|nr:hypothetical protein [uncultured Mediterranean phage uvMED]BAR16569.1 hypothetical protein [uncultured Mediterranean phage uvMED]
MKKQKLTPQEKTRREQERASAVIRPCVLCGVEVYRSSYFVINLADELMCIKCYRDKNAAEV